MIVFQPLGEFEKLSLRQKSLIREISTLNLLHLILQNTLKIRPEYEIRFKLFEFGRICKVATSLTSDSGKT